MDMNIYVDVCVDMGMEKGIYRWIYRYVDIDMDICGYRYGYMDIDICMGCVWIYVCRYEKGSIDKYIKKGYLLKPKMTYPILIKYIGNIYKKSYPHICQQFEIAVDNF